ncbi:MAG: methyltransferase domain-containing protein [Magnetococcales bacterium]|nr:methyltransferase domain-containing protein [Magnetococcales bacterium]
MGKSSLNREGLKHYYGTVLQGSQDLKTSACCTTDSGLTSTVKAALARIDAEVRNRFYGCGSPLPPLLEGCTVVDLGCGSGRDVFLAAQLVGPQGRVIGIDMTDAQLAVARDHVDTHMARFGYDRPNVELLQGYMEDLQALGIADGSVDVVISNCVLNLSPDKRAVFGEIFRVLKPGGELFFADVFSGRRIPQAFHTDPVLHGECLAGAMYREDFRRLLRELGYLDYRMTEFHPLTINNPEVERIIGMVDFHSVTARVFKLADLEDICEDYGQMAVYRGTIPDWPHHFDLDDHHRFITGKPVLVCGNTASMLTNTRYRDHFTVHGDRSVHYGPFDCGPVTTRQAEDGNAGGGCC